MSVYHQTLVYRSLHESADSTRSPPSAGFLVSGGFFLSPPKSPRRVLRALGQKPGNCVQNSPPALTS